MKYMSRLNIGKMYNKADTIKVEKLAIRDGLKPRKAKRRAARKVPNISAKAKVKPFK